MGLISAIQNKTEQARARERIRPLLESRMMRDILLEIGQRGTEKTGPPERARGPAPPRCQTGRRMRHRRPAPERHPGSGAGRGGHHPLRRQRRDSFPLRRLQLRKHRGHRLSARRGPVPGPATARLLQHQPHLLHCAQTQRPLGHRKRPSRSSSAATTRIPPSTPSLPRNSGCSDGESLTAHPNFAIMNCTPCETAKMEHYSRGRRGRTRKFAARWPIRPPRMA